MQLRARIVKTACCTVFFFGMKGIDCVRIDIALAAHYIVVTEMNEFFLFGMIEIAQKIMPWMPISRSTFD